MARSAAERMRDLRKRRKAAGLREIRLTLVDTCTPEFKAEARRQSLLIANSPEEQREIEWIEALQADQHLFEDE